MKNLTDLEKAVMEKLLDGEDEVLSVLRQQLKAAVVSAREMTGVGFYTTFSVPDRVSRVPGNVSFKFGDVIAKMRELKWGAGFLLYVQEGALHMLEGYTYDEQWPGRISSFELNYTPSNRGELENLRKVLHK